MSLRFVDPRRPESEAVMSAIEREQLSLAWERLGYDEEEGDRLAPGALYAGAFEQWTVVGEAGAPVIDVLGSGMDLAAFAAGEATLVGAAVQHVYEGADDDLSAALARAERVDAPGFVLLGVIDFPVTSTAGHPLPRGRLDTDWSAHSIVDPLAPAERWDGTPWPRLPAGGLPSKARALLQGTDDERAGAAHYLRGALDQTAPDTVVASLDLLLANLVDATNPSAVTELALALHRDALREAVRLHRDSLRALLADARLATAAEALLAK